MSEVEKQIRESGEKAEVMGNHSTYLREKGAVWFLEKGSVNLFAIERKEGKPEGHRTLITTISAPSLLFSMPVSSEASHEIVAITESESLLWKAPFQQIEQSLSSDSPTVHKWINSLAHFYGKEIVNETQTYIEAPKTSKLEKEETLSLKRALKHDEKSKINWLEIEEGEVEFLGYSSLPLQKGPFPLTYNAWLKSSNGAVVKASSKTEEWKKGLGLYHHIIFNYLLAQKGKEEREERRRAELRVQSEDENIHDSLKDMVLVLNSLKAVENGRETAAKPLLAACNLIGDSLKMHFRLPEDLPETIELPLLVSKITEASDARSRQVRLTGEWWKKDSGPLLAFYGDELNPVALIPKRSGYYEMVDPVTGLRTKVNQDLSKELARTGYTFYPSFPHTLHTGREMIRFYLKHNTKEFAPLFFYSILTAIISLFPPFATEILINRVIPQNNFSLLLQISIALLMAALSSSLFLFFRSLMVVRLEGRSSDQIQSALWDRLLKLPVSFFRRYTTGNLIMRVLSTERMRSLLSGNATRVFFSGIFSLFYIVAMVVYAPVLTFIALAIVIAGFLITLACAAIYSRMQKEFYELEGRINAFLIQIISAVGKLRTAGAEKNAFSKWAHLFAKYKKVELHSQHVKNIVKVLNFVLPFIMYLAIFGFVLASSTKYSVGAFLAFNIAFVSFYLAMTDLGNTLLEMTPLMPLWDRARVIVQEPLEEKLKTESPGKLSGEIHIDEVCFQYEDSDTPLLQNISLKANPKEFIGIIGPSGCGKSTLIRLLLGFERPKSGAIYYDDKDLATFAVHDFRKQLGVVLQEEGIVAGSIYDNLTCGGIYKPEQVERALQISGFGEDVESFPMGMHTYLSMGGSTLSGGQKQRLLIARALLPNPKILLLDEATSALDNRNQERVIKSINQLDVTRIVIAHRLSTIKNADRIYAMEKGRFVQVGTFEELASQPGLFADMLKRQTL